MGINNGMPRTFRLYRIMDAAAKVYAGLVQLVGRSDLQGARAELIREATAVAVELETAIADEIAEDIPTTELVPFDALAWSLQTKPEPGRFYLLKEPGRGSIQRIPRVAFCTPDGMLEPLKAGSAFWHPTQVEWIPLPSWQEVSDIGTLLVPPKLDDGGDILPE